MLSRKWKHLLVNVVSRLLLHGYEPDWEEPVGAEDQGGDDPGEEDGVHFVRVFISGDPVGFWIL